jgi:stage 0 sporulation regulatory protein
MYGGRDIMLKFEELSSKIDETRTLMTELLEETENPLDTEVIKASELLDTILNDYHKVLQKSKK